VALFRQKLQFAEHGWHKAPLVLFIATLPRSQTRQVVALEQFVQLTGQFTEAGA